MAQNVKNTKKSSVSRGGAKNSGRPKGTQPIQKNNLIREEVVLIVLFAVSVLLFLSNFHLCGVAGDFLRKIQLGLFGTVGFLIPLILFVGTCFYLSNRSNLIAKIKFIATIAALVTICGFLQLLFGAERVPGQTVLAFYQSSSASGAGGGLLGGVVVAGLQLIFGKIGTYFVLFILLLICLVCITEKSIISFVKKGSGKAYHYARDDIERRRQLHEEKRLLRESQTVSGVDLNATRLDIMAEVRQQEAQAAELEAERHHQADVFTGRIQLPEVEAGTDLPVEPPVDQLEFLDLGAQELHTIEDLEQIFPEPEVAADPVVLTAGEFAIPEAAKRVETASGKIIETDTEALHKKIEQKRAEKQAEQPVVAVVKPSVSVPPKEYRFPPLSLLVRGAKATGGFSEQEYKETAIKLQKTLQNFGVGVTVTNISCGPSVTRYELHPEQGVKVSKIVGLTDDIKLSLAAADIRIEAPIPGKSAVGIEVPNKQNTMVLLRDLLEAQEFQNGTSRLSFAVGKDIGGQVVVTDIAKMPHLLIAGATGSGKSVCINTLIMSLIYKADPNDVKMIMIDPKVVELSVYNGIPHLLIPVVTDPKKAAGALNWAVAEMEDRYQKFAQYNVRDLKGYNEKVEHLKDIEDEEKPRKLPQIVIIIDELADLMMVAPGDVEDAICRLAQLARAAGIHLIIATQRPSVNVITGLIKANVPSRIAFSVSSGVDSRTIIDMNGAEKLLGKGDMLFYPAGYQKPQRVQGAFVSDQEVSKVVDYLLKQELVSDYQPDIESKIQAPAAEAANKQSDRDEYFHQAGKFVIEKEKASIGMLQRVFKIGFNRAARIMDQLSEFGVVGEEEGTKPRKVLMTMEEFEAAMNQQD